MRTAIDPARADAYPANIQAILKRQAPCSAWLGQELLEIDAESGFARIAYALGEAQFNRFGALHGGAIACVMGRRARGPRQGWCCNGARSRRRWR